jgi:hypothetical protein
MAFDSAPEALLRRALFASKIVLPSTNYEYDIETKGLTGFSVRPENDRCLHPIVVPSTKWP